MIKAAWYSLVCVSLLGLAFLLGACRTGIDSTPAIKPSRSDMRAMGPTAEEQLADSLRPLFITDWRPSKEFLATDDRLLLLFSGADARSKDAHIAGHKLSFLGDYPITDAGGAQICVLRFRDMDAPASAEYDFPTKKAFADKGSISSSDLPLMIDLEVVERADRLLSGRRLWTKSRLWYDESGERVPGLKFAPVTITAVKPGNSVYPLKVEILTDSLTKHYMWMNVGGPARSGSESRTLSDIFMLSDPRMSYPGISDETWALIMKGNVCRGMTKLECKLALGSPKEAASGHDWNNTIDLWSYPDGSFLRFEDGLLISYRLF